MQSFRKAMSEEAKDAQEWQRAKGDETRGGPELSGSNWQEERGEAGCIPRLSFSKDGKLELPAGLGTQQRKVTEAAWKRRGNRIYLHIGLASSNEFDAAAFDTYATLQVGKNTLSARQYFKRGLWEAIRHDCEYARI